VAYDGGTGQFTFQMTLQNLLEQPIGTTDGLAADPAGIRVFFDSLPVVTGGSGTVSVVPDGFATLTAASQPYYRYDEMLVSSQVSGAKTWTLVVPPTVTTFRFPLLVSAPVAWPDGYVTVNGRLPTAPALALHPDSTLALTGVVKTALGTAVSGATVTWSTSEPLCATVTGSGVASGVRAGSCSIVATAGTRSGSLALQVTGTVRTWSGGTSAAWTAGANWVGGVVPAEVDSVVVPAGGSSLPAIETGTTVGRLTLGDATTLSLGGHDLTVTGDVATGFTPGSGILGTTGRLILAGEGKTIHGRVPRLLLTGTYTLSDSLIALSPVTVDGGRLDNFGFLARIVTQ
jgi:hypothetical protein